MTGKLFSPMKAVGRNVPGSEVMGIEIKGITTKLSLERAAQINQMITTEGSL